MRRSLELYLEAAGLWRRGGADAEGAAALRRASQQKLMLGDTEGAFTLLLSILHPGEDSADICGKVQTLSLLSRAANDARLTGVNGGGAYSGKTRSPAALQSGQAKERIFLRLPATQREARSISSYLGADQSTIFTGVIASRENLINTNFADYKIVHLATHGSYDEENPELSGIVLSQFGETGNSQNGYLRLNEIYQLSMPVDLVVLSSCSSGRGENVRGEGVVGLTRGFLQTGSKWVLSGLWKVDDAATAEFMKYFYEALLTKRNTPAEALRQAQIKMRQSPAWQSPFYWAAFILHGDFRHTSPPANEPANVTYLEWAVSFLSFFGFVCVLKKVMIGSFSQYFKRSE